MYKEIDMSKNGQKNNTVPVRGNNGLTVFAPNLEAAAQLLQAKADDVDTETRVTVLGPNGSRAFTNIPGAALLLGAKNGHVRDDQLAFRKEGNGLYLVYGTEKVLVVETNKPVGKMLWPFVMFAAKLAGLPEADLIRMFPANGNGVKPAELPVEEVKPAEAKTSEPVKGDAANGDGPAKKTRKRKAKTADKPAEGEEIAVVMEADSGQQSV